MNTQRNTLVRSLHDLGGAAWFGGSLMGAVALNGASGDVADPGDRIRTASAGWARWSPVAATAVGAHLVGGLGLLLANRDRVRSQSGTGSSTVVKSILTVAALGTTAYSGYLGARLGEGDDHAAESGTVPDERTATPVARAQQQLRLLQWVTPALTGGLVVLGALQGEQQKAGQVLACRAVRTARRLRP